MKTADNIYNEMKSSFMEKTDYEVADDCDMGVRMRAAAVQIEALYIYGQWITRQCYPQTAQKEYLDRQGELRGIKRKEAEKAKGEICFFVSTAAKKDIKIPSGTVCMNSVGTGYVTTSTGVIAVGETACTVCAEAAEAGKAGNAAAGTIIYMSQAPIGVEGCKNMLRFTGGKNAETDDEYRERILTSYKAVTNGANASWYEKTALAVDGVTAASVVSCPRGAGSVDVYIMSSSGMPDSSLLAAVQSVFDDKREICTDVRVLEPIETQININAAIKIRTGYEETNVFNAVKTALTEYFEEHSIGSKMYLTEIGERIYHVPGVESYKIVSPDYDYSAASNVLLQLGTVTLGRWD